MSYQTITYQGLTVIEDPVSLASPLAQGPGNTPGTGGGAISDNVTEMAVRIPTAHHAVSAHPNEYQDVTDSSGAGHPFFYVWSKWMTGNDNLSFMCTNNAAGAADWFHLLSSQSPSVQAFHGYRSISASRQPAYAQGNGAVSLVIPDSSARGDCSTILGGKTNSISAAGDYGVILGGKSNAVNGASGVAMGIYCTADARGCAIGGYNSVSYNETFVIGNSCSPSVAYACCIGTDIDIGQQDSVGLIDSVSAGGATNSYIVGGGLTNAIGDSQLETIVLGVQTTTATTDQLQRGSGTDGIDIPSDTTYLFEAHVVARRTGTSEAAAYRLEGVIENEGGTTAIVGSVSQTIIHEDDTTWNATATADDTNDRLNIDVTGAASKTIRWVARVELTVSAGGA